MLLFESTAREENCVCGIEALYLLTMQDDTAIDMDTTLFSAITVRCCGLCLDMKLLCEVPRKR